MQVKQLTKRFIPVLGHEPIAFFGRVYPGKEMGRSEKNGEVIHQGKIVVQSELANGRIDLVLGTLSRFQPEGEGDVLWNGRDRGQQEPRRLSLPVPKGTEEADDPLQVAPEVCCRRSVAVQPKVVRSQLKKDHVGMLCGHRISLFFKELQILCRSVPAPAEIQDAGGKAVVLQDAPEEGGVALLGEAVARAENDHVPARRGGTGKRYKKNQEKRKELPSHHVDLFPAVPGLIND
jgi:hypothetical protein